MRTIGTSNDRHLSVVEVAERLGCSKHSVYRRLHDGSLPAERLGGGLTPFRVLESDLADWLDAHRTGPPDAA